MKVAKFFIGVLCVGAILGFFMRFSYISGEYIADNCHDQADGEYIADKCIVYDSNLQITGILMVLLSIGSMAFVIKSDDEN